MHRKFARRCRMRSNRPTQAAALLLVSFSLLGGASNCFRDSDALDPATNSNALLAWLIGYTALQMRVPECGFATPAYRVANPVEASLFFDLRHSRGSTTFNLAQAQMAGCTPTGVVDSGLPATFSFAYHANRVIQTRTEVGAGRLLTAALSTEDRPTLTHNDCVGGGAIENIFTYDSFNRLLRKYSVPNTACGWFGDETTYQYDGISRLPARSQYYDSPGVLYADSISIYTIQNGLIVGLDTTCEGGNSCTTQGFRYTYNSLGQLTLEEELYPGMTTATYLYDAVGRISTVISGANTVSYTYDAAGRLTQMTESSPALTLSLSY